MARSKSQPDFYFGEVSAPLQPRRVHARVPAHLETKEELLDALYVSLSFPDYFGGNWNALDECIRDLSWLRPLQVVVFHEDLPMETDRVSLKMYVSILRDAVAFWRASPEHALVVVFPKDAESTVLELLADAASSSVPEVIGVRLVNALCLAAAAVFAVVDLSDLVSYLREPNSYVFGTEVAGFRYVSAAHFLGAIAVTVVGAAVVVAVPWVVSSRAATVTVRVAVVAGLVALTVAH